VHLVGFIIRIYHDARSSGCQMSILTFYCLKNLQVTINQQKQRKTGLNLLLNNVLSKAH